MQEELVQIYERVTNLDTRSSLSSLFTVWGQLLGDVYFACPMIYWAQGLSRLNKDPSDPPSHGSTRMFMFEHKVAASVSMSTTRKDDLDLVLGGPLLRDNSRSEQELSLRVILSWSTFAKTG